MLEVIEGGLETSIQDYPGRIGFWGLGIPPSGPMDSLSFRLANLLVGNQPGEAGLEIQFTGPKLRFQREALIAVTGADMSPKINGEAIPLWKSVKVKEGDVLALGFPKLGCRSYLAIGGGIDIPSSLGSKSTFVKANIGGFEGRGLKKGDILKVGEASQALEVLEGREVKAEVIPQLGKEWEVEVTKGPHDDWLSEEDLEMFLSYEWKVSARSDRTGYRFDGPEFKFGAKAYDKPPENGSHPSNIIDYGYPLGSVNLCGQTPIILTCDGPSLGGFIVPFTVVSGAMWKVGQAKPGDVVKFKAIDIEEAHSLRRDLEAKISEESIVRA